MYVNAARERVLLRFEARPANRAVRFLLAFVSYRKTDFHSARAAVNLVR